MTWITLINRLGPYLAVFAIVAGIAFGGWTARGWYGDSLELERQAATSVAVSAALESDSKIAAAVEQKLAGLKANQTVIDRGVISEVIKPVYRNVCLPDDGVRLLNAAATSDVTGIPAEPNDEVPEATANPE